MKSKDDPLEFVTFSLLNKQPSKFLQDNQPHLFHASFYPHSDSPSAISSRFHPLEDDDVDTYLPWHIRLEEDTFFELASDVSR